MDKELEGYYNNYFELFMTAGWKQLMEDLEETHKTVSDIRYITDSNDFMHKKGQVEILNRLLNFKELIESSYKEAQE